MLWLTPSFFPASSHDADHLDRLGERERDRLLGEDALHVVALTGLANDLQLLVGREGDVDDLDALVVEQVLPGVVDGADARAPRPLPARCAGVREAIATTSKPASP